VNKTGWISPDTKPEPGKPVLVLCRDSRRKMYRVVGHHLPRFFEETTGEEDDYDEYCEEKDAFFFHEGWWETVFNWDYANVYINDYVVAWRPLPAIYSRVG